MVLVVSIEGDYHTRRVLDALAAVGEPALVLEKKHFPQRASVTLDLDTGSWRAAARFQGVDVPLAEVRSAWWRRSEPHQLSPSLQGLEWKLAYFACNEVMKATWRAGEWFWVNRPDLHDAAEHKPLQLSAARAAGLAIPRTCITNDPQRARSFAESHGGVIQKDLVAAPGAWEPTRPFHPSDEEALAALREVPTILQERVVGDDLRVTVVGDDLFAAAIEFPGEETPLDWRPHLDRARVTPVELPEDVEEKLRRVIGQLRLVYAAVDVKRRPGGEHVFLEVNPAGQWLFVEERTGQPITAALAGVLARGRP
jgi:hypothetical protein